jgi:hypothetical protein
MQMSEGHMKGRCLPKNEEAGQTKKGGEPEEQKAVGEN